MKNCCTWNFDGCSPLVSCSLRELCDGKEWGPYSNRISTAIKYLSSYFVWMPYWLGSFVAKRRVIVDKSRIESIQCWHYSILDINFILVIITFRYLLYDINPGEGNLQIWIHSNYKNLHQIKNNPPQGFNLRRDVYMRMAVLLKKLQKHDNWVLVGSLFHFLETISTWRDVNCFISNRRYCHLGVQCTTGGPEMWVIRWKFLGLSFSVSILYANSSPSSNRQTF